VPSAAPGTAGAYDDLVESLSAEMPANLQGEVPWPDTRNPDPIAAQISIFDYWVWLAEHHPEPVLTEIMTAPGSPSRESVSGTFGEIDRANQVQVRVGGGYQAFEHLAVTFESAGLPQR